MDMKQVNKDLKDIKYYYMHKQCFPQSSSIMNSLLAKATKYANVVKNAPAKLIDLYVNLYQTNASQLSFAVERAFTPEYICRLNKELRLYLVNELSILEDQNANNKNDTNMVT